MGKGRDAQRLVLMRCGDSYGYGLWVNDGRYSYKDQPDEVGMTAYLRWLHTQPLCGHKKCETLRARWRKQHPEVAGNTRMLLFERPGQRSVK